MNASMKALTYFAVAVVAAPNAGTFHAYVYVIFHHPTHVDHIVPVSRVIIMNTDIRKNCKVWLSVLL